MQPEEHSAGDEQEMHTSVSCNAPTNIHSVASSSPKTPKVYPSILGYSFQCTKCYKWRLVPTKEVYENIRANISANPFFCEMANQWQRNNNISCEDPSDVVPDGSRLWAIDKPNIPLPPLGWRRELRFRAVGGTRFAEVFYYSPFKRRFRSIREIEKYLKEHPEDLAAGININQFCFETSEPLFWKRKHPPPIITSLSHDGRSKRPHQSAGQDEDIEGKNVGSAPIVSSNS
ncbi:PREDICTED: methyl-CpG-binding domain-containing protein 2-like isoform X2 [Ipomoea nil]|nr:PREDICTED: methyl-CpG-binding domain-containing protein 2-like isoform X2 [Ipomoea nil]XP_019176845.1 PREDICTED: methyl-CpG-binding domain-containing protein 2-like isoform X2 [Ipomoea nil]XP_019176846.1 PREDICTED: methyl-CpG-binding domain-containing protein 2-like isoform X2 [Ipomoea nil]